jgi:hypothetical protein
MKRELLERKETELRGVVVELYTLLSTEGSHRPQLPHLTHSSKLPGPTRASMASPSLLWLHDDAAVPGSRR